MPLLSDNPRWDYPGNIGKAVVTLAWVAIFGALLGSVIWALAQALV